jgi:hypothetical protein
MPITNLIHKKERQKSAHQRLVTKTKNLKYKQAKQFKATHILPIEDNIRQKKFLDYLLNSSSPTFANVQESALLAGYDQGYASTLTSNMPDWFKNKVKDLDLINKA